MSNKGAFSNNTLTLNRQAGNINIGGFTSGGAQSVNVSLSGSTLTVDVDGHSDSVDILTSTGLDIVGRINPPAQDQGTSGSSTYTSRIGYGTLLNEMVYNIDGVKIIVHNMASYTSTSESSRYRWYDCLESDIASAIRGGLPANLFPDVDITFRTCTYISNGTYNYGNGCAFTINLRNPSVFF